MDGSEEDRLRRQNDLEKQGPWVLPTSFSDKRTLISDNGLGISSYNSISPEPGGLALAGGGSSSSGSRAFGYCFPESTVYSYNASLHTIPAIDQTADFLQTPFAHIPLAFPQMDADQNPSFSPNHFLVNENVLMTSSFSEDYGQYQYPQNGLSAPFFPDLNFFPEAAACMNITMTPAKDKEIQGSAHGELLGFVALNSKESKLETNAVQSSDLNFSAPLTLDKEKRVQGCIPPQVINLIGQGTIVGENNQELCDRCSNCNSKQCSCTQQGVEQHTWSAPSQQLESGKDEQGNNPGLSSKGPQKKKTRKRYMPKVFQEGKPIKTPKSVTPKPVTPRKHENQTSKRSYVRKKKTLNSSDTSPHTVMENVGISSAEGTSATPHVVNEIKPVRRKLDFESEGGAANVHLESAMTNTQPRRRGRPRRTPTSSGSRSMPKISQEMEIVVENSPVFDICHSLKQMLQYCTVLPKDPKSPLQSFKKEPFKEPSKHFIGNANSTSNPICGLQPKLKPAEKKVNRNGQADLILTEDDTDKAGTKWSYHRIDISQTSWTLARDAHFMQASKEINQASRCDETSSHNLYSQEMHKRMRTEKPELGSHQFAQHCSKGYASADAQKLMISDKSQSPESVLIFNYTKRPTKKRSKIPVRARKITSTPPIIDCNHQLLPTPKKPPETCLEALFSGNSMRMKRKRSTRKAKANLAKITSLNADHENKVEPCIYSSLEQNSVGLTASGGYFQENNLHPVQLIPIEQHLSSNRIHEPPFTYSMSEAIVPYGVNMNDVVWKVQELDIEGRQVHSVAEPQNALVPYGGSMIVPFEKPLDTSKKQRGRAKVELDDETHRVWKLLMGKECNDEAEGSDEDKEKRWEEERRVFHGRVGLFIARMRLVQGERCFSPWKGSVVDSVVGVFLTQNVSDHLSSSAFIALAARFPLQTGSDNADPNAENMNRTEKQDDSKGSDGSNLTSEATNCEEKGFCPNVCDQGPLEIHDADYVKGNEMASINESIGSNTRGNKEDDCKGLGLDIHVREPEIGFLMPHYRIDTLVAVTGSTESEDRQSLEDVVSSQNSVTSPENSLDYLIQTIGLVGSSSGLHSGANLISGSTSIGLGNSALLEENVCMADATQKQEIEKHGNVRVLSEETCSGYDKEEKKNYGLNNLKSTCRSISYAPDSHLKCSEHNTSGVPSVPSVSSAPSPSDNLNLRSVGMKNINVVREIISNLPSTASENIDNNNVKHCNLLSENTTNSAAKQSALLSKITEAVDSSACKGRYSLQSPTCSRADQGRVYIQQEDFPHEYTQYVVDDQAQIPYVQEYQKCLNSCDNNARETLEAAKTVESNSKDEACSFQNVPTETAKSTLKAKKAKAETEKAESFDWDSLRRQAYRDGYQRERSSERMDSLDWEAVRCADVNEISGAIRERGMNNVLAGRIKDFLNRLVKEHGSIDLEWLRDIPPDKAKDYLLSIRGLGLKSVECVRLLALRHLAFPVDTNVGRICVRLGWVPLQPLPESLQLHLLEMYPMMATIQKFLWPRLCKLDQETLYELHYQMITFGKVFCTKTKPNCNACPMRGECKHFASAFASARLALPGPEEKSIVSSTTPLASRYDNIHISNPAFLPQPEESKFSQGVTGNNNEPIIEEPASPEPAPMENLNTDIDDVFYEDPDIIPTIKLNFEEFKRNLQNYIQDCGIEDQEGDMSKAIVAITEKAASIPMPKLKNVRRLRTEHQVYVIPDSHPILEGLEQRERDDHCPYLLTIWTPGETAISTEPPETCCNSQDTSELCDNKTCFACSCRQEEQAQTIRGTILIPCRTAMRGRFPLNGTYFQKNEVFADHETSISPIHVPRKWIWNLPRRTVHFGTSVTSIFRGLTTEEIQQCFVRGNICVRGFERKTRAPRPLCARLHFPASKAPKNKKTPVKEAKK